MSERLISKTFKNLSNTDIYTLPIRYYGQNESGWLIVGTVNKSTPEWLEEFRATHKNFGTIFGDFNVTVFASNQNAIDDFTNKNSKIIYRFLLLLDSYKRKCIL